MTLHTVGSTEHFGCNLLNFTTFELFVHIFICLEKGVISKLNFSFAMTIDAPSHTEIIHLHHLINRCEITMAFGTIKFSGIHMLGMAEEYIESPHHIEFQILADQHGNVVHLFERE